jgi:hypothetical protein
MKKILFIVAAALVNLCVAAQNAPSKTTLYIDITVDCQEIVAGPYARYAQKYLGVAAPLADKVLYEITSAKISEVSNIHTEYEPVFSGATTHMNPLHGFPKLLIDRTSGSGRSLEESASLAAAMIFDIRKSRYELITGDAGENVFGAGLGDALRELDRLEEEYLSLFLGKQTNRTTTRNYNIIPSQDEMTYVVCRFTTTDGLLPEDDLSGEPVVLELKPVAGSASSDGLNIATKPTSKNPAHRLVPDVRCRIIVNGTEMASTTIPIEQFGRTVYLAQ